MTRPRNLLLGAYRVSKNAEDIYARLYCGIPGVGMPSHKHLQPTAAEPAAGEKVLERLMEIAPLPPKPEAAAAIEPKPDEGRLAALTQAQAPVVAPAPKNAPAPAVPDDAEALKQAEGKLSSFLNLPKQ